MALDSYAEKYRTNLYVYKRSDYMFTWYVHTRWWPALLTRVSLSSSCDWHAMIVIVVRS